MKKIIKEYEVFNYEELSEKAKEKALNNFFCNNNDFFDFYYDDYKNNLINHKDIEKLNYINEFDISECDLDYGGYVKTNITINIEKYINYHNIETLKPLLDIFDDETAVFKNKHNDLNLLYSNYYYELAEEKSLTSIAYEDLLAELEKNLIEDINDLNYSIHKIIKKEYEYYTSKEYFIELCRSNEYTFLANGDMFNE